MWKQILWIIKRMLEQRMSEISSCNFSETYLLLYFEICNLQYPARILLTGMLNSYLSARLMKIKYTTFALISFFIGLNIYAQNDTIIIDLGNNLSSPPWNNIVSVSSPFNYPLINSFGYPTDYFIAVTDPFTGINNSGTTSANPGLKIPGTASSDSFFGNTVEFNGNTQPTGGVTFNHLDPAREYTVEIFSSRMASDNRETRYMITGQVTDSLFLQVANNTDSVVSISLYPAADSTIDIIASPGPNNNNSYHFFYLGVIRLIYEEEMPGGPPVLSIESPVGGEYWQSGKEVEIIWESQYLPDAVLYFSANGGSTWSIIDTIPSFFGSYLWLVPDTLSANCMVKITSDTLMAVSPDLFEIGDDSTDCHIVILGSSTAAGAGANPSDSSWVKRYKRAVYQKDTRISLTNFAMGGYTTYHLLPTGTIINPPTGIFIDTARNISKALSLNPYAVIVNLPSNDAANNIGVDQQMENFGLISAAAINAGVDCWVCTTQPRNFSNSNLVQIQMDVRDSIFSEYGEYAIDFWNGIADTNGFILPQYDYGDGVHLNNAGHRILFQRALEKDIDTLCGYLPVGIVPITDIPQNEVTVYPNPARGTVNIRMPGKSEFEVRIINTYGELFLSKKNIKEEETFHLDLHDLPPGIYIIHVLFPDGEVVNRKVIIL